MNTSLLLALPSNSFPFHKISEEIFSFRAALAAGDLLALSLPFPGRSRAASPADIP